MPAVAGLKKQGATNGTALAFMVSTPENGVDSIALTYSLLDPIMTIMRPLAGFVTGAVAGILEHFREGTAVAQKTTAPQVKNFTPIGSLNYPGSSFGVMGRSKLLVREIIAGQRYAFGTLFNDIASWYFLGIILAGCITHFLPDDILTQTFGQGMFAYLVMLVLSLPIYVCATFSTPVAAAMIAKGLSPGSALIFLLAGPATNMATISMLLGLMGKRSLAVYLFSIVVCTLGFAYLTDYIYSSYHIAASANMRPGNQTVIPNWLETVAAVAMMLMILKATLIRWLRPQ